LGLGDATVFGYGLGSMTTRWSRLTGPATVRFFARAALVLRESVRTFQRNRGAEAAATLAYYSFLGLVPLVLLVMFLLSRMLLSSQAAMDAVREVFEQIFPQLATDIVNEMHKLSQQRAWSALSAVILFWSVTPLAGAARRAMTRVLAPDRTVNFFRERLRDALGAFTLLALFLLVVFGRIAKGTLSDRLGLDRLAGAGWLGGVRALGLSVLALMLFYLIFSPVRLRLRHLVAGASVAAALLFVMRPAFAIFLRFNPDYGFAFGSLKAVFLLLTWVYLSFVAILLGAETIANARRSDAVMLSSFLDRAIRWSRLKQALVEPFVRRLAAGERVFGEGDAGREMFYVRQGSVRIRHRGRLLRTMKSGDYFGELSMLIDTPRTADAEAAEAHTELVAISRENLDIILRDNPHVVFNLLRELAIRLKATNDLVAADREAGETPRVPSRDR
jgi:membrane protein